MWGLASPDIRNKNKSSYFIQNQNINQTTYTFCDISFKIINFLIGCAILVIRNWMLTMGCLRNLFFLVERKLFPKMEWAFDTVKRLKFDISSFKSLSQSYQTFFFVKRRFFPFFVVKLECFKHYKILSVL